MVRAILPAAGFQSASATAKSRSGAARKAAAAMIGRPTVQPNCHYSVRDYLYDVLVHSRTRQAWPVRHQTAHPARHAPLLPARCASLQRDEQTHLLPRPSGAVQQPQNSPNLGMQLPLKQRVLPSDPHFEAPPRTREADLRLLSSELRGPNVSCWPEEFCKQCRGVANTGRRLPSRQPEPAESRLRA